jgi:hypothetical protein
MPFLFEKLEVYQKAVAFAERASSLTEGSWAVTGISPIGSED